MKFWIKFLVLISSFQVNAECHRVAASTLAPDLKTAYSVPFIGLGPFYNGYGWDTLSSKVTGKYDGIGQPGIYLTTENLKTSRDGKYLAGTARNFIMVWDVKSQTRIFAQRAVSSNNEIGFYEVAGNKLMFATVSGAGNNIISFTVVDLISKNSITYPNTYRLSLSPDADMDLSENGDILFYTKYGSGTVQSQLVRLDIATGGIIEVPINHDSPSIYVKDDIVYTFDKHLRTYKTSDLSLVSEFKYPDYGLREVSGSGLQVSLKKNLIKLNKRYVADLKTGQILFVLPKELGESFLTEDGTRLGATTNWSGVYIYDTSTWKLTSNLCADL